MKRRIGWLALAAVIVAAASIWQLRIKPAQEARRQAAILKRQMASEQRLSAIAETVATKNGRVVKAHLSRIDSYQAALCVADATELEEFGVALMARPDDELALALRGHTKLRRLSLLGPGITDRSLAIIGKLDQLEELNLESTRITDDGLIHLAGLKNLRDLNVSRTDIRGPGVTHLAGLPKLVSLTLRDTLVDDAGLKSFGSLKQVQFLTLTRTEIRGPGLKHLAGATKLGWLRLGPVPQLDAATLAHLPQVQGVTIEDAAPSPSAMTELEALKGLKSLRLDSIRITDAHLEELTVLPRLTELYLYDHELSEAGLGRLEQGTSLRFLQLGRGPLDEDTVRRLSERLPQTKISWSNGIEWKRLGPMP